MGWFFGKKQQIMKRVLKVAIIAIIIALIALVIAIKRNDETQYKIRLLEQEINKLAEEITNPSKNEEKGADD
jgi:hypothetical protein